MPLWLLILIMTTQLAVSTSSIIILIILYAIYFVSFFLGKTNDNCTCNEDIGYPFANTVCDSCKSAK